MFKTDTLSIFAQFLCRTEGIKRIILYYINLKVVTEGLLSYYELRDLMELFI